jgi:hypothetical protein
MPNVLDVEPMRVFARRAARKIMDEKTALRFEKLALAQLLEDPRNFRPAQPLEIYSAPAWAREAYGRGEMVSVFRLNDAAARRLRTFARKLADTCKVAATDPLKHPTDLSSIVNARAFLSKINRVTYDVALEKAKAFSRKLAAWEEEQDSDPLCPEGSVTASRGNVWSRVRSPTELRRVGREFVNCLARASTNSYYISMLRTGLAQFWVLRDSVGNGLMVVMAATTRPVEMIEVRGPRNARVAKDDLDLFMLATALGMNPPRRPPPPPPFSGGAALALAASRPECQCTTCRMVRLRFDTPLRENTANL